MLSLKSILWEIINSTSPPIIQEGHRTLKGEGRGIIQAVTVKNALANPRRRQIMAMLELGDTNPDKIIGEIGASIPDYHIDVLESAGLIEQRIDVIEMTKLAKGLANPGNGGSDGGRENSLARPIAITSFSHHLPCPGDQSRFRISARISPRPGNAIELLGQTFPNSLYSDRMKALVIPLRNTIVTLYSSGNLSMVMLKSEEEAWEILEDLTRIINQSNLRLGEKPRFDHMEINRHLPHTNCGQCGEKNCYFFAVKLAGGATTLDRCIPLKESRYSIKARSLEDIFNLKDDPK